MRILPLDREGAETHRQALVRMEAACFRADDRWDEAAWLADRPRKWDLSLALVDGEIIRGAAVGSNPEPGTAHWHRMLLDPAVQGAGWGRRLAERWLDHCRSTGFRRATMETRRIELLPFFESLGWRRLTGTALAGYLRARTKPDPERYLSGAAFVLDWEEPG